MSKALTATLLEHSSRVWIDWEDHIKSVLSLTKKPGLKALGTAYRILQGLAPHFEGLPFTTRPGVETGEDKEVLITFWSLGSKGRYATFECGNGEGVLLSLYDKNIQSDPAVTVVTDDSPEQLARKIKEFVFKYDIPVRP